MMTEKYAKLRENAKPILLIAALFVAVLLLLLSKGEKSEKNNADYTDDYKKLCNYTDRAQGELEEIIGKITGAGNTKVMLTFESSFESVYANNAKLLEDTSKNETLGSKSSEKEIVLVGDRINGEAPILLKEICPKVKGVLVVCQGGDNIEVCKQIKNAMSALFGISESKICVTSGL